MVAPASLRALALLVAGARAEVYTKCAVRRAATHALVNGTVDRLASAGEICATGASLPAQLYEMATMAYVDLGALDYAPTSSASGKDSVLEGVVDFAGSESVWRDADYLISADIRQYPSAAAAIVPVLHLPLLDAAGARLVVDRETLPLIFLGDIYEWTDPRLLALQSDATRDLLMQMPDAAIHVVVRDDGSGTTEIFSNALSLFSDDFSARVGGNDVLDWCEDGMDKLPCPGNTFTDGACDSNPDKFNCYGGKGECEGVSWLFNSGFKSSGTVTCAKASHEGRHWAYTRGAGTAGLVAAVQSLDGSIGYAVLADVNDAGLTQAMVVNRAGSALIADPETVSFALLELGGFLDERGNGELFDASSTFAYPIVGFTYYVLRKGLQDGVSHMDMAPEMFDCRTRLKTLAFLEWFYTSTAVEGMAKTLGFTNLPKFISSALLDEMLAENYCVDAETGEMRLVKARAEIQVEELYTIDFAVKALVVVTTVYKETDANVAWRIDEADASAALARGGVDTALGVAALFAADAKPTAVFSAPFMTVGFSVQYHLGTTSDVSLTHAELAAIYTCTVKTWRDLRADLPDQPIRLVVRSDECDAVDVFTAALSFHVPSFATAIGPTRALDAALLKSMGCTVVAEVQSDTQVESAITFYDFSLGWWTKTTGPSAKLASFSGDAEAAVKLDAASLRACEADPSAVLAYDTKAFNFASSVYDLSPRATGAADCWPYSRSYNMVINEQLLGPRQCEKDDKAPGQGPSQALALVRWIYAGKVFDSLEASSILSPSAEDRLKVLAVLDQFPLSYCNPATRTMAEALTLILVLTLCAAGFMVCFALCSVNLYRRRVARMLAKAQIVLPENVQELLEEVWATVRDQDGGAVADYIPELAAADPTPFAIVLCDIQSGALYEAGDATKRFTLQSASKPLLYCLALEDNGMEAVDKKVGSEPTGGPFNVVSFDTQGRPFNPYVNAGAICTAGLVAGASAEERFRRTMSLFNSMSLGAAQCGTSLDVAVYDSEMATNGNNQTIVQEALKRGLIPSGQGQVALDAYTMACSLSVDCREVACVAATLANNGVNPQTGEEVMPAWVVNRTVSTMMTCGMYNGAGAWMVEVGIPAKSGVGGIIMCVVPGICGFAAFSPRLDQNGNSTRGVLVARELSNVLSLHVLHQGGDKEAKPAKKVPPATPAVKIIAVAGKAGARADDDGSSRGGRPAVSVVDSAGDVVNYSEESKGSGASMA
mmetsp:Transcript_19104/g.65633  ORF Transcript_19104/g.65633 Transcript_19104/m.65633 type:complete len:1230 (+) Transcript_19104:58-3747(+)